MATTARYVVRPHRVMGYYVEDTVTFRVWTDMARPGALQLADHLNRKARREDDARTTLFDLPTAPAAAEQGTLFDAADAEAYLIGAPRPAGPAVEYPAQQLTMPGMRPDAAQGALIFA